LLQLGFRLKALPALWPVKSRKMRKLDHVLSLNSIDQYIHFSSTHVFPTDAARLGLKAPNNSEYRQSLINEAKKVFPGDPMRQVMFYDMHTYLCSVLDRNDIMTMAASIECRVPFLDYRIVEGLMTLPTPDILRGGKPKGLLREALGSRLPTEVLEGRKWGFGIPWHLYYANIPEYRDQLLRLDKHPLVQQCFTNPGAIKSTVEEFLKGNQDQFGIIHQLMSSRLWYESHFG
jgi:asparagine synthase (glutamine-hydrolysing)